MTQPRETQSALKEARRLYRYDTESGKLIWLVKTGDKVIVGRTAGATDPRGCVSVRILGHLFKAHRVIWAMQYGRWPISEIDHINGDCGDNHLENLREANRSEQMRNTKRPSHNTSGFKGVSWEKRRRKWRAYIKTNGKVIHLGLFEDPEKAHAVYKITAKHLFGDFASGG